MATMERVQKGLEILRKYGEGDVSAEHDIIYAGPDLEETDVSAKDREELDRLGWHYSKEFGCWARFT